MHLLQLSVGFSELPGELVALLLQCIFFILAGRQFITQHTISRLLRTLAGCLLWLCLGRRSAFRIERYNIGIGRRGGGTGRALANQCTLWHIHQAIFQRVHVQATLAEQKSTSSTAPAGVTTHNVGCTAVQFTALITQR